MSKHSPLNSFPLQIASFFDVLANLTPSGPVVHNKTLAMEQIGQNYGFILYRTKIPSSMKGPAANISIPGLRDRGIVFVNQVSYINCLQLSSILKEWMGGGGVGLGMGRGGTLHVP